MNTTLNRLGVPKRHSQDWGAEEMEDMRQNYRRLGWREMMKRLKRSKGSILGKANEMKLSGKWVVIYDNYPADAD